MVPEGKAVELGVEEPESSGFLRFLNRDGRVLAGLNSSAPKGAATLYLGDEALRGLEPQKTNGL